jgi:formylmethanofuran dehydrogenase subunit C
MATSLDRSLVGLLGSIEVFGLGDNTGRTGTASITLGALTSSSAGTVAIDGDASITLGALTSSSAGTVLVDGDLTATLGAATVASTGTVATPSITGTLTATALTATGTVTGADFSGPATGLTSIPAGQLTGVRLPTGQKAPAGQAKQLCPPREGGGVKCKCVQISVSVCK